MDRDVEQRFAKIGLHVISPQWLASCREYFQKETIATNNSNNRVAVVVGGGGGGGNDCSYDEEEDDEILFQILNTDLRNVIRHVPTCHSNAMSVGDISSRNTGSTRNLPSKMLRQAIQQSTHFITRNDNENHNPYNNHVHANATSSSSSGQAVVVLPPSFQLLLQVEELLDVSLNAEDRLSLGPASLSSPTPVGNQKQRCLKMLLSDGYFCNGDCCWNENVGTGITGTGITGTSITDNVTTDVDGDESGTVIVAMETEPIPNLSVHSKPGIKVVLTGPIEIRFGILMLHPGNTTVLGGCIPALIPIQKKAMDMAAKLSGVGIDPTFRALVWNPESGMGMGMGEDGEDGEGCDEGEGESRDLPPVMPLPVTRVQPQPETQPQQENLVQNRSRSVLRSVATVAGSGSGSGGGSASDSHVSSNPVTAAIAITNTSSSSSHVSSSMENPYKRSSSHVAKNDRSSFLDKRASMDHGMEMRIPTQQPPPQPRPLENSFSSSTLPITKSSQRQPQPKALHETTTDIMQQSTPVRTTPATTTKANTHRTRVSLDPSIRQQMSPTALSEPMSFVELGTLLQRIIVNPDEYRQYEDKIFIVACKYAPPHKKCKKFKGFDIQKQKDYKKRGVEKYEFAMTCQLMGSSESMGKITCKITHAVLKPYFNTSAAELRTMIREDKEKANKIANEGGTNVLYDLKPLSNCYMRLIYSCEEFFKNHNIKEIDGEDALLELFQREDLMM